MKVTDKRMFTPEGELRKDSGQVESSPEEDVSTDGSSTLEEAAQSVPGDHKSPDRSAEDKKDEADGATSGGTTAEDSYRSPGFLDLVALLAEPTALYLGDVPLPDGKSAEDLALARLHIDLLDILQQKTTGNLSNEEASLLNDLLYRLRMRFVQKKG